MSDPHPLERQVGPAIVLWETLRTGKLGNGPSCFLSSLYSGNEFSLGSPGKPHLKISPQKQVTRLRSSQKGKFMTSLPRQRLAGLSEGLQSYCFVAGPQLPIWRFQFQGLERNTGLITGIHQSTNSERIA